MWFSFIPNVYMYIMTTWMLELTNTNIRNKSANGKGINNDGNKIISPFTYDVCLYPYYIHSHSIKNFSLKKLESILHLDHFPQFKSWEWRPCFTKTKNIYIRDKLFRSTFDGKFHIYFEPFVYIDMLNDEMML